MALRTLSRAGAVRPSTARAVPTLRVASRVPARGLVVRQASSSEPDFDAMLASVAEKFEKAENKPAVIGYLSAAVGAVIFSEWLIHLPGLNILLGFPVQFVGLLALPVLGLRYAVQGKDLGKDATDVVNSIAEKLPGLEKK